MDTTTAIVHAISTPLARSLLSIHPNDATLQPTPAPWSSWWTWAADAPQPAWLQLLHYFMRPAAVRDQIPLPLRSLIDAVRSLQLERTPSGDCPADSCQPSYRVSPKKAHEVERMSAYIRRMDTPRSVWHAVDVGSGQVRRSLVPTKYRHRSNRGICPEHCRNRAFTFSPWIITRTKRRAPIDGRPQHVN